MADDPAIAAVFRRPFADQVEAFRRRLAHLQPTAAWDDLWQSQHDRAFVVAGALKADLLADLGAAIDKAISQGTTLEEFRRDFRRIVAERGWHGWTGEGSAKGEAWRTRVIYQTNLRTSYAAGRFAQLTRANFAFWVYRHGGSLEPRLHHLALDGIALPPDHPFWATHYPPNGWGCSCYVVGARSPAGVRRLGGDPDKPLPDGWDAIDPRTGAPRGIDKGWAYAPGASSLADPAPVNQPVARKAVAWPYEISRAFMAGVPAPHRDDLSTAFRTQVGLDAALRLWAERVVGSRGGAPITGVPVVEPQRSLGLLTTGLRQRLAGAAVDVDVLAEAAIDADAVRHILKNHGDIRRETLRGQRVVTPSDFGRLAEIIEAPDRITPLDAAGQAPRLMFEKRIGRELFVAIFEYRRSRRRLSLVSLWIRV